MKLEKTTNMTKNQGIESALAREQLTILFTLWLLVFSASSQLMIVVAMLPLIGEQLSISTARQGLLECFLF